MRSRILYISGRSEDALRLTQMLHPLPVLLDHVHQRKAHIVLVEAPGFLRIAAFVGEVVQPVHRRHRRKRHGFGA